MYVASTVATTVLQYCNATVYTVYWRCVTQKFYTVRGIDIIPYTIISHSGRMERAYGRQSKHRQQVFSIVAVVVHTVFLPSGNNTVLYNTTAVVRVLQ